MDTLKILLDSMVLRELSSQTNNFSWFLTYGFPVFGTLLGTLLGFWLNSLLHRKSYRNEYYKKIIDKRLEAYELLAIVLRILFVKNKARVYINSVPTSERIVHSLFKDYESFKNLKQKVIELGVNTFWFSNNLVEKISELNLLLFEIEESFDHSNPNTYGIRGIENHNNIVKLYVELLRLYYYDLITLYSVDQFLSNRSKILSKIKSLSS